MTLRRLLLPALAMLMLAGALTIRPTTHAHAASGNADLVRLACSMPHEQLVRTWRGWRPDRGAQLSFIPKQPNFVGSGLPHVGPWDYIQHVPMLWYGPGIIKRAGRGRSPGHGRRHRADRSRAPEVRRLHGTRRRADDRGAAAGR